MLSKYITVGGPVVPGLCTVARTLYPVCIRQREDAPPRQAQHEPRQAQEPIYTGGHEPRQAQEPIYNGGRRCHAAWHLQLPRAAQEPPRSAKALPQMSQESPGAREPSYVLSPWREAGRRKLLAAILFMTSLPGSNSASGEPPERPGSRGQERSLAVLPGSRGQERSLAVLSGSRGQERSLPQCTKDLNLDI